jgi:endo-1,4-beta-D-glucanase Y
MRRSSTLFGVRAALVVVPLAAACATSQPPVDDGTGGGSSSSGSGGSNGSSGAGNSSGSSGAGNSSGSSGASSGSSGARDGGSGSSSSGSSSGTASSSGSSSSGVGASSSSSGAGASSSSSGAGASSSSSGGIVDAGASKCGTPGPNVLSDFEQNTGNLIPQGGRTGWWYVFADTLAAPPPVPTPNPSGPIATVAAPAGDKILAGETCNDYALYSKVTGHTSFAGVGATFIPNGSSKTFYTPLATFDGIQFDIQNVSGTQPMYLEIVTGETQTTDVGGLLPLTPTPNPTTAHNNNRGYYLAGAGTTPTNTSTALPATMTTVYVPFSLLIPRHFPEPVSCGLDYCQAPAFVPTHALGFQFSAYPDMNNTTGSFELNIDNVSLYTGDNGLNPASPTTAPPAFNDGAVGFASCKAAIPTFEGTRAAAGKYLLWGYNNWKERFVQNGTVIRPENGNDTVSEGIGYGMLLAVYFNDQATFDSLWTYSQAHKATGNLMTWCIPSGGGSCPATGGTATDADEDMAFALVEAGKRTWSTSATYAALAPTVISQVWTTDIDATNNLPKGGSNYGAVTGSPTNPSYFAPAYYRHVFATADTTAGHNWASLADHVISVVAALGSANRGLVPAWCGNNCTAPAQNTGSASPTTDMLYQYDAHRVPWRMGLDYCWNGTTAAQTYLNTISGFFNGVFANGIDTVYDLYQLNGGACTTCTPQAAQPNSMSIVGTAAVGALSGGATYTAFVQAGWQFLLDGGNRATLDVKATGASPYSYFNATVGLLTALTLSGNFYPM